MASRATLLLVPTVAISLLLGGACALGAATPTPAKPAAAKAAGDPTRGKALYDQSCGACHGPDARGIPGLGKDLTTGAFVKGQTDAELVDFIKKGRPASDPANTTKIDMPPKGGNPALTDAQIADIVASMRTLQR
ncbi:MAG: cytochrome c [Chloroflexi bacterium]|nr:cytochrome c [Chloroflexota bacterium]